MNLFYTNEIRKNKAVLSGEEARHCVRVLRHKAGDEIHFIDGEGGKYTGQITDLKKARVEVSILERFQDWGEHTARIRLAVSPLRIRDRFEFLVEKAVELGVNEFIPLVTVRTVKPTIKPNRIHSIMISALKQCKRSRMPLLHEPTAISDLLEAPVSAGELRLIASCETEDREAGCADVIRSADILTLFIGPEGDFSPEELESAMAAGCLPVSFGPGRLRTETAAIYGLSMIKLLKEL
jgi:16S rRNA (uracil1498-N3)-methyltransferase